jgi:ParB family chromosome partitioning protein
MVPVSQIRASRYQPRTRFNEDHLRELADSIREQGLIQPLIVAAVDGDGYELIAGERRLRAARLAGLSEVPIVVKKVTDKEQFQISLIENLQREDLNPIEEASAFKRLMEEFSLTQEELAKTVGKSRVAVANTLRLLNLPEKLRDAVSDGSISAGHARNLVSIGDARIQDEIAGKILSDDLSVREVEKMVSDWKGALEAGKVKLSSRKDPAIREMEESLQRILGTKVDITARGKGKEVKGSIKIAYYSLDDLERLVEIFKGNHE